MLTPMSKPGPKPRPLADRVYTKVRRGNPQHCWPWLGYLDFKGRGRVWARGGGRLAKRIVFEIEFGPLDDDEDVLQSCANVRCCNPYHLWKRKMDLAA